MGIKKGDTYNGILLKERIADDTKPDGEDLTNLYQNSGYLFSNINAVEVSAENDTINFEIRVTEGKLASFNKITVVGNDKTNDHVIFRELRTKPGELYSKDKVVRTVRELGQLGFFDPENISPDFKNVNPRITALSIVINIEGINWFTLFNESGVDAEDYIDTISSFILNGLKKKENK